MYLVIFGYYEVLNTSRESSIDPKMNERVITTKL